jgi:hypothetical protein
MTSTQLEPPSDDQLDSAYTTVEGGQDSQVSKNTDISQKDNL